METGYTPDGVGYGVWPVIDGQVQFPRAMSKSNRNKFLTQDLAIMMSHASE